ncbi:SurA N-terminal domain-containing protein [Oceanobacillus luteolus]|uniref:SurA N-terminal domain-containing protein n=1 Tax=Oceanobacillus luteolus TaxID=1274358 RepID=A0ABW4HPY0_9BACI|nr:SurA N-terminal domain-containing protein [Oceanobacillus luteolus]MCM3740502.1 SurA N-terminal domain-containing protein [Oceanobacillus luteolus]
MKKRILLITALFLTLLLAACNNDDTEKADDNKDTEEQATETVEISDEEKVDNDSVVLNINGTEINGAKYNNVYKQYKTMLHMYGQDVSDLDMLKDETVLILTEQELIRQDALDSGIEVTEEDAQEEIDNIIETNGEEAIQTMLEEYDLSEEQFREQLMDDLLMVRYIESEFTVEVTDEEVEEQYNQMKEQSEEVGELQEYEELIRQSVMEQKQREMLEARIEELKEEAEIETLI